MKKISLILRKCKSLSKLGRSSSYSSLRSKSVRNEISEETTDSEDREAVLVGNSRRRYMIRSKHLSHPLLNALIERSKSNVGDISIPCEVVIFDHLLWMLENADPSLNSESMEELVELYSC
ncbi:hypothetical protein AMTRI_Chr02g255110 [Amborella trichopoda]|uniref:Uncharacterized protein n=1 Tax=Amborella trichopoda TaxID=13333 RepID=U5D322_AMBTC|nr:uncharacterized protein LOC18443024 [Amborella trichopoda]ERN14758.1 hypothetical protein AMTR_s00032p00021630 [Amborella trichopoda]|eukprot:XP_006853291.1 uncharacterized protein LOC18443024 [Amborella trichopoda]